MELGLKLSIGVGERLKLELELCPGLFGEDCGLGLLLKLKLEGLQLDLALLEERVGLVERFCEISYLLS